MEIIYEYVHTLAKLGSFSSAAKVLHISQPALSIAIKKYENELNFTIFDRTTSPLTLTPHGKVLFSHIEKVMLLEHNFKSAIDDLDITVHGNLKIGATQYFTSYILPTIISNFKNKYPEIEIEFIESNYVSLSDLLLDNKIDLMFSVGNMDSSKFTTFKCITDYIFIAIPRKLVQNKTILKYTLTRKDIINNSYYELDAIPKLSKFKKIPFIMLRDGNTIYARNKMIFELEDISPPVALRADQLTTAHHLCKNGMGATFTTGQLIRQVEDSNNLVYFKFDHPLMIREFNIQINKNKYISKIIDLFIKEF